MGDDVSPIIEEIQRRLDRHEKQTIEKLSVHKNCPSCGAQYEFGKKRCSYCGGKRLLHKKKEDRQEKSSYIPPVSCF